MSKDDPKCFVIHPFQDPFGGRFGAYYEPAIERAGMRAITTMEQKGHKIVINEIWEQIEICDVCLADVSLSNGNVYYEVGFAHALRKPVVTVHQDGSELKFDLKPIQSHAYAADIEADPIVLESAIGGLADRLELARRYPWDFRPLDSNPRLNIDLRTVILDLFFPAARIGLSDLLDDILREKNRGIRFEKGDLQNRFGDRIREIRDPIRGLTVNVTSLPHARSQMKVGQETPVVTFLRDQVLASLVRMSDKLYDIIVADIPDLAVRQRVMGAIEEFHIGERRQLEASTTDMRIELNAGRGDVLGAARVDPEPTTQGPHDAPASFLGPDLFRNYVQPQPVDIQINGRSLRYAESGTGPAILYFHGTGTGFHSVFPRERALIEAGFRVVIPNRPGYPGTTLEHGRTPSDCAVMAAALLDKLGIQKVAAIGLSGGGPAALAFAERNAERTVGLILQAAQTHRWDHRQYVPELAQPDFHRWPIIGKPWFIYRFRTKAGRGAGDKALFAQHALGGRFDDVKGDPATGPLIDFLFDATVRDQQSAGTRNDFRMFLFDRYPAFKNIVCPTLIIHDPRDTLVPIVHARDAQAAMPNAELFEVAAGGHQIWLGPDAPTMHARRVEFLKQKFQQA